MPNPDKDKKKHKVQRLVDVEVTHVSLVDRPANRTPFKAIKRDEAQLEGATPMNITLKNLFGTRLPEVTSVMADTADKAMAVAKMIMTDGSVSVSEQEGVFIARKTGTEANDAERIVHMGKRVGIAYTVAHAETKLTKALALYDSESMDFGETVQKEGFVPGLYTATEALHTTIRNIAMDEETKSPTDFNAKVSKALDAFGAFVSGLIEALPEQAFKFEKAMLSVISPNELQTSRPEGEGFNTDVYDAIFGETEGTPATQADTQAGEAGSEGVEDAQGENGTGADPQEAASTADTPDTSESTDTPGKAAADTEGDSDGSSQGEDDKADAAPANLEELPKGAAETQAMSQEDILAGVMEGLTKTVGASVAEALAPLTERMDAQDATIQKMSKAVGGAVLSAPEEDDDTVVHLNKSGGGQPYGGGEPPLMDTAYRTTKQG